MAYLLAVDIGTTSVKAIAFDRKGAELHKETITYDMQHPQPDYAEQDPEEITAAVFRAMEAVAAQLKEKPLCVSFSAAMHSLIAVDAQGQPLTPCIIWADNRAAAVAMQLRETAEGQRLYERTGVPIHAMSPFCKLIWLRQHQPELFERAYRFIDIKSYTWFRLFGRFLTDTSVASASGLLNMHTLQWDEAALQIAGVSAGKLPELVPVDCTLTYQHSNQTLPDIYFDGVPFVIGLSDGAAANIGAGATDHSSLAVTIGTSGAVRLMYHHPVTDPQMRTFCYHAGNDRYIVGGASNNGAVVMQWLKEDVFANADDFDDLYAAAASIPAGSEGLVFVPYILGERAPLWKAGAKGLLFGLTSSHRKAHLLRAGMEGVIFALYSIAAALPGQQPVRCIQASGGFARSILWVQMLADVFNTEVWLNETAESSAWGAAITGAQALGLELYPADAEPRIFRPDPASHTIYRQQFALFSQLAALSIR
jgi:gluconokinase